MKTSKKTLILATTILMLVPSVAGAYGYYRSSSSFRYRARWSPRAFGLVPDDVRYSPYAFKYGHSGLITEDGRPYRPADYSPDGRIIYVVGYNQQADVRPSCAQSQAFDFKGMRERRENREREIRARKARIEARKKASEAINAAKEKDREKIRVICEFLKTQNMGDFEIADGGLSIANKKVSTDFVFKDMVIRFWNAKETEYSGYRRNYYEKHKERWRNFCREYDGKIYEIKAADEEGINAQLCELLAS